MNSLIRFNKVSIKSFWIYACILLVALTAGSARSQSDSFGMVDMFYIDSLEAAPGEDISVNFYIKNDELLSSLSIPITYDANILKLKSISYNNTRVEYIANKIINPSLIDSIDGHFLVSLFILLEDPLPVGEGVVFTALFNVLGTATEGTTAIIDSLFYPPGGELFFIEHSTAQIIYPSFKAGKILIRKKNNPPVIASIPVQNVFEGDSIIINIYASDIENDSLVLSCPNKPVGAAFVDNNNGSAVFSWQPEFIGLYSADGSPFVLNFWVNDGVNSVMSEVVIEVVNKNRKPVITSIDSVYAEPGDILEMSVAADDPDLEPIVWQIIGLPQEAVFDYANPGVISWTTSLADTGVYDITVIASDPQGLTDTSNININLRAVSLFTISLDTVSAFPGDKVDYEIILDNKVPIGSFNILFNYDQSALTLYTVTNEQTRSEGFEYFTAFFDEGGVLGRVRLVGIADLTGGPFMPFLDAGVGPIASISFRIISDVNFSGVSVPVRFLFLDSTTFDDNTLTDSSGNKIEQASIIYNDGYVIILKIGDVSIGDINLNGIQYEVGDVIYFSNFFMNPAFYPLNPLAYANSDVNQDNISATIADLIALINVIVGSPNGYGKDLYQQELTAKIRTEATAGGIDFIYETNFEVGGIFISFFADDDIALNDIINYMDDMTMIASRDSSEVRMLIYSLEGNRMPFGENSFVGIDGRGSISINNIQFATNDGQLVEVSSSVKSSTLPDRIKLYQNYPNPFNPETQIDFELVKRGRVKLTIYNVLGKKVKTIIDNEELTAGIHSAPWDSRNDNSEKVASGIYLYRLETESGMLTRKMMLLK